MTYTAIDNSQSVIQHYGKKGMKWGVRSRHQIAKWDKKLKKHQKKYDDILKKNSDYMSKVGG